MGNEDTLSMKPVLNDPHNETVSQVCNNLNKNTANENMTGYFPRDFGRKKDGNRSKFIGFNLVVFCYKELEKFALCKAISQSEVILVVYSGPSKSGLVKINFSK